MSPFFGSWSRSFGNFTCDTSAMYCTWSRIRSHTRRTAKLGEVRKTQHRYHWFIHFISMTRGRRRGHWGNEKHIYPMRIITIALNVFGRDPAYHTFEGLRQKLWKITAMLRLLLEFLGTNFNNTSLPSLGSLDEVWLNFKEGFWENSRVSSLVRLLRKARWRFFFLSLRARRSGGWSVLSYNSSAWP
jgi:hypothetical protein